MIEIEIGVPVEKETEIKVGLTKGKLHQIITGGDVVRAEKGKWMGEVVLQAPMLQEYWCYHLEILHLNCLMHLSTQEHMLFLITASCLTQTIPANLSSLNELVVDQQGQKFYFHNVIDHFIIIVEALLTGHYGTGPPAG